MKERFAINIMDVNFSLQEQLVFLKEAGFEKVTFEFNEDNENQVLEWANAARLHGLLPINLHAPIKDSCYLWIKGIENDRIEALWYRWIDMCAEADIATVTFHPTYGPDNVYVSQTGVDTINRIAEYAEKHGVIICLENLRTPLHTDYIFERLDCTNLKFCLDTGHEIAYTPEINFCKRYADYLAFTHLHDNDGIKDHHWLPGDGIYNWDRLARTFLEIGYCGPLTLELAPPAKATISPAAFAAFAKKAYKRLIHIFGE